MSRTWRETDRSTSELTGTAVSIDYAIGSEKSVDMTADVRWDGCVHLRRYFNGVQPDSPNKGDSVDYLHVCDLDQFIAELQALRKLILAAHDGHWPG